MPSVDPALNNDHLKMKQVGLERRVECASGDGTLCARKAGAGGGFDHPSHRDKLVIKLEGFGKKR